MFGDWNAVFVTWRMNPGTRQKSLQRNRSPTVSQALGPVLGESAEERDTDSRNLPKWEEAQGFPTNFPSTWQSPEALPTLSY